MQGGSRTVWHLGSIDSECLFLQFVYGFAYGGEVIEYVLRPNADAHCRTGISGTIIYRLGQEQKAGYQPFFVHAVARTDVVACCNDTAVFGSPLHCFAFIVSGSLYPSGKDINITHYIFFPVHCTTCDNHIVRSDVSGTRACVRLLYA